MRCSNINMLCISFHFLLLVHSLRAQSTSLSEESLNGLELQGPPGRDGIDGRDRWN